MDVPRAPRPTRVASYALHFQIPILPTPTPPSLLKRASSSCSSLSSIVSTSASGSPGSFGLGSLSGSLNSTRSSATIVPTRAGHIARSRSVSFIPSPSMSPRSPASPSSSPTSSPGSPSSPGSRAMPIPAVRPAPPLAPAHTRRRTYSGEDLVPHTPYSTPLDAYHLGLSYPAFNDTRPPLLRRDTPRPAPRGDETGLGIDMSL